MPTIYRRHCDHCGRYYEKRDARHFCSWDCYVKSRKSDPDPEKKHPGSRVGNLGLPQEVDEDLRGEIDPEKGGTLYVPASAQIRNHEELIERAGIDPDAWMIERHPIRTWPVAMKLRRKEVINEGTPEEKEVTVQVPMVLQLHYVGLTLKPALERVVPRPLSIFIKGRLPDPPRGKGSHTTIHFGDVHFPFQDDRAIRILLSIIEELKPGGVYCHGDLLDCEALGTYPKDPDRRTTIPDEVEMGATFLGDVTATAPRWADFCFLEGNHEDRLRRMKWGMAEDRRYAEILSMKGVAEKLTWEYQLGLGSLGWEFIPYKKFKLLREKLVLIHGDAVRKPSAYTARVFHDRYQKGGLSGHTHRLGSYFKTDFEGSMQAWHELGLLGRIRDDYTSAPNWQQGFGVVTWTKSGRYSVELVPINWGGCVFRGRTYGEGISPDSADGEG